MQNASLGGGARPGAHFLNGENGKKYDQLIENRRLKSQIYFIMVCNTPECDDNTRQFWP